MDSIHSSVEAELFMEDFEVKELHSATLKPSLWLTYFDDTFVNWSHGEDKLHTLLTHLNRIHKNIQFTMEIEHNGQLSFLDVLITRNEDGHFGHTVYGKKTHTNRYVHAESPSTTSGGRYASQT